MQKTMCVFIKGFCSPVTTGKKEALRNMFIAKQLQRACKSSPARTRTSDLVVTLNPKLLSEVDYIFAVGLTLRQQVHSL